MTLAILSNLMSGDGLIIFVIILLLFGAKRLPELAKGLGSAVREFSKAKDEIEHEITRAPTTERLEPPRETQPYVPPVAPVTDADALHTATTVPTPPVVAQTTPVTEETHQQPKPDHPAA